MKDKTVLLVDDEKKVLILLSDALEEQGFNIKTTTSAGEALRWIAENNLDAVVLDLIMPELDGVELLKKIKKLKPGLPVIMLSGHGTIGRAVEALKLGAYDFLEKPVSSEKVAVVLKHAISQSILEQDKKSLLRTVQQDHRMVGRSRAMTDLVKIIKKIATADSAVLISGESGTGKDMVARSIHLQSARAAKPFLPLNCAAIPDNLLESELFGHVRGAFTDAHRDKPGLLELADSGTLFLDEISAMSLKLQPKLLRTLENKVIQRVGATTLKEIDIRLISATNRDLEQAMNEGSFRDDLYYRVSVLTIQVPPLRERKEDIPLLTEFFMESFCSERKISPKSIQPRALECLVEYSWPGNVRQLKNLIEKMLVLSEHEEITAQEVNRHLHGRHDGGSVSNEPDQPETLEQARKQAEREKLIARLHELNWNYEAVAESLAISRATLFNKLKSFKISKHSKNY